MNINWDVLRRHLGVTIPPQKNEVHMTALATTGNGFPFALSDLKYWVVRRKDGVLIKYQVVGERKAGQNGNTAHLLPTASTHITTGGYLSAWCRHNPEVKPTWTSPEKGIDLFIADSVGVKQHHGEFNLVIDCGSVLPVTVRGFEQGADPQILFGDPSLVKELSQFQETVTEPARVLRIEWFDRAAPNLTPEFWPALAKSLEHVGTVLINCQGGHGRSGTCLVLLMMVLNPEYTPKDAIIHLRAVHCPRAIESKVQHEYINKVAKFLGRPANAFDVHDIKDYKAAFLALDLASAAPYQKRLKEKK